MKPFDVKSLFTKVPIDEALEIIKFEQDETLEDRTLLMPLTITNLIKLICMASTYFENVYQQLERAPMGSPLSLLIYIHGIFELDAIESSVDKPELLRYVDDTFRLWKLCVAKLTPEIPISSH